MKFFKYRIHYSSGPSDWVFVEVNKELQELNIDTDTEHFRRIEWKEVKKVPEEYINKRISLLKQSIKSIKAKIDCLSQIKTIKTKKSCLSCCRGPKKCGYGKGLYKNIGVLCTTKGKEEFRNMY